MDHNYEAAEKAYEAYRKDNMTTVDQLRSAIREGRITVDEQRRLYQVLAEIAFRLWYDDVGETKGVQ